MAQCAKSLWSGLQSNGGAESLMRLTVFITLSCSFYKCLITAKSQLNEPAELAEEYSPMRGFASLGYSTIKILEPALAGDRVPHIRGNNLHKQVN
jgi:hypothetical protein